MSTPFCRAFSALLLMAGSLSSSAQVSVVDPGQAAADFTAVDLDGTHVSLQELRGQVVLICFHSEAMSYSRRLLDQLVHELHENTAVRDQTMLVLVERADRDLSRVQQQLSAAEIRYRLIPDTDGKGVMGYDVVAFPTVFCVGPQGRIIDVVRGYGPRAALRVVSAAKFALGALDQAAFESIREGLVEQPAPGVDAALDRTLELAGKLVSLGQLDSAEKALVGLGEKLHRSPRGLALLTRLLLLQQRTEDARAFVKELAQWDPDGEVEVLSIRLHILEGDLDRAESELDRLPGDRIETHLLRGMVLESRGRCDEAARLYRETLERLLREGR